MTRITRRQALKQAATLAAAAALPACAIPRTRENTVTTEIAIDERRFLINGRPTYEGVSYKDKPVEGLPRLVC